MYRCQHLFFFNDTAPTEIYTLSLHDALPIFSHQQGALAGRDALGHAPPERICPLPRQRRHEADGGPALDAVDQDPRSEEHTSELQSRQYLVCRLLLEKKKDAWMTAYPKHPPD